MTRQTTDAVRRRTRERRKSLLPLLKRAQDAEGFLSREAVRLVSRELRVSENEIYGVATFYPQFRFEPPGRHHIQVCLGNSCHVGGAPSFIEAMRFERGIGHGQTTPDRGLSLEAVGCLGCCAMAPVVVADGEVHGRMNRVTFMRLVESLDPQEKPS